MTGLDPAIPIIKALRPQAGLPVKPGNDTESDEALR
jgi:hypothetical protein